MIVRIAEVAQDFTKNGAEYKKVKCISNGKEVTKSVFDNLSDKWALLKEGVDLEFVMEKKGQFWNVIDIKEIEAPAVVKAAIEEGAKLESVETKVNSGDSKNRAFALSYSKDVAVAVINKGKETTTKEIIDRAKRFCEYLDTGE